ncbi:MAG: 30S ribosome-binding factor RbfA [Acidobacteriota bacterium]|nr:30S ribosome-binding factor RbfA [Acidobacteriota bacterium]MDH3523393.1 30S ribosome-binding factor RbfA [Acidobacteriota bacterium]
MSRRTQRVEDLLRAELADLLLREARDPRLREAHVSAVEVSPDLGSARVRVSILAGDEERRATLDALNRAAGFFRTRLAGRLRHMRRAPALAFELDRGPEHSQRISELLENSE